MNLLDIIQRSPRPAPWAEGEKIPWHEPAFSKRMLKEHLSQSHDAASRRAQKIDMHVRWIHDGLLDGRPTRILDIACGPGLYTSRLARRGHDCVGVDYAPASIAYARDQASQQGLRCRYVLEDIRAADFGDGFGLAMFVFGEFNVFRRDDAHAILEKAHAALNDGGQILFEVHTLAAIEGIGAQGPSWHSATAGLFSDEPHLYLQESCWDQATQTATIRYLIIDAASGRVTRHALTNQGYSDEQYRSLLAETGFEDIRFFPSLTGSEDATQSAFIAIAARKQGAS